VLETTLDAEMTEHLGYDRHGPAGRGSGNSRNGVRTKMVFTEIGPVGHPPAPMCGSRRRRRCRRRGSSLSDRTTRCPTIQARSWHGRNGRTSTACGGIHPDSGANCCKSRGDSRAGDIVDDHTYVGPAHPVVRDGRATVDGEYGGLGLIQEGNR
jgi:hypothetical protein